MFNKTIKEGKILVLDIETAGVGESISMQSDLIVEIGITAVNLFTGEKKLIYDEIVNEGIEIDHSTSWVFKKTNLTFQEVQHAKPLNRKLIQKLLNSYYCTAFNKSFDFGFLGVRNFKINEIGCLMERSTDLCKIPPTPRMAKYRPDIKYKNPNAQEAYDIFYPNNEYTEIHRAGDDSFHEADIAKFLYDNGALILPSREQ